MGFDNRLYLLHSRSALTIQQAVQEFCNNLANVRVDLRCDRFEYPDLRKPNLDKWFILDLGIDHIEPEGKASYLFEVCKKPQCNIDDQLHLADNLNQYFTSGEILVGHGCLTTIVSSGLKKLRTGTIEVKFNYHVEVA